MWLACHTQEEIAEAVGLNPTDKALRVSGNLEDLPKNQKSAAEHATDSGARNSPKRNGLGVCEKNFEYPLDFSCLLWYIMGMTRCHIINDTRKGQTMVYGDFMSIEDAGYTLTQVAQIMDRSYRQLLRDVHAGKLNAKKAESGAYVVTPAALAAYERQVGQVNRPDLIIGAAGGLVTQHMYDVLHTIGATRFVGDAEYEAWVARCVSTEGQLMLDPYQDGAADMAIAALAAVPGKLLDAVQGELDVVRKLGKSRP